MRLPISPIPLSCCAVLWCCLSALVVFPALDAQAAKVIKPVVTSFSVNSGQVATLSAEVQLTNSATGSPTYYQASESSGFSGAKWLRYSKSSLFRLTRKTGVHWVYFRVKNSKYISAVKKTKITLVNGVPVTVLDFELNGGQWVTTSRDVPVTVNIAGNPTEMMLSEDASFSGASWTAYAKSVSYQLSSGEGQKTVYLKARNKVGLISQVASAQVEYDEPPTLANFSVNSNVGLATSSTVWLFMAALGTPAQYMISEDPSFAGAQWLSFATNPTYVLSAGSGPKTVYVKLRDGLSESPVYKRELFFDEAPQLTAFTVNNGARATTSRAVAVHLTAVGAPQEMMISEDGNFSGAVWQPFAEDSQVMLSAGYGSKRLYLKLRDEHTTTTPTSVVIRYDLPVTLDTFFLNGSGETQTKSRQVSLVSTGAGTPLYYRASETALTDAVPWNEYPAQGVPAFDLSAGDGTKTVYFQLRDDSGVSAVLSDTIELKEALLQTTVGSSGGVYDAKFNGETKLTVFVPSNELSSSEALEVYAAPAMSGYRSGSLEFLHRYDIRIGNRHQFSRPITLYFYYDPASLRQDLSAQDQLSVAYYDTDDNTWKPVPSWVDTTNHVIVVQTYHLSIWGDLRVKAGYQAFRSQHFRVIYNTGINAPLSADPLNPTIDGYAALVRQLLESAFEAYSGVTSGATSTHFRMPQSSIDAIIDDYGPDETVLWDGDIRVPNTYFTQAELQSGLAHELFHAVQYEYFQSLWKMAAKRWFVEATAEWASGGIAGAKTVMGSGISAKYLEQPFPYDPNQKDRHKYHSAWFIEEIVSNCSALFYREAFKEMFESVAAAPLSSPAEETLGGFLPSVCHKDLGSYYLQFALGFFSSGSVPIPSTTSLIGDAAAASSGYSLLQDSLSEDFSLREWTSKLWGISVEDSPAHSDRLFRIKASSLPPGVYVNVFTQRRGDPPTGVRAGTALSGSGPAVESSLMVPNGSYLFVQAINYADESRAFTLEVEDLTPVATSTQLAGVPLGGEFPINGFRLGHSLADYQAGGSYYARLSDLSIPLEVTSVSPTALRVRIPATATGVFPGEHQVDVSYSSGVLGITSMQIPVYVTALPALQQLSQIGPQIDGTFTGTHLEDGESEYAMRGHFVISAQATVPPLSWNDTAFATSVSVTANSGNSYSLNISGHVDELGSQITDLSVEEHSSVTNQASGTDNCPGNSVTVYKTDYSVEMKNIPLSHTFPSLFAASGYAELLPSIPNLSRHEESTWRCDSPNRSTSNIYDFKTTGIVADPSHSLQVWVQFQ